MNLPAYKEQLRLEILGYFETNGVVKTMVEFGINRKTYYGIKHNEIKNTETIKKWHDKIFLLTGSTK